MIFQTCYIVEKRVHIEYNSTPQKRAMRTAKDKAHHKQLAPLVCEMCREQKREQYYPSICIMRKEQNKGGIKQLTPHHNKQ
jgi:hypothetical protein